jgi:GntR family transcriptional regulator
MAFILCIPILAIEEIFLLLFVNTIMRYSIDHKSPISLHVQAENLLRQLITEEQYQNGKNIPNEVDLADMLGISRTTLRIAINKLVFEGLLIRKKRAGTKVAPTAVSSKSNNWLSFSQEMKLRGIPIKNFELHVTWVLPEPNLAKFFDIKQDTPVLKMERVRGRPEEPFVFFASYFHPRVGLTPDDDFKRPLYELLEHEHAVIATLSKEEIRAIGADELIAEKLHVPVGSPILFRKRFVYDQGEQPIEYNVGYYKADSFIYTVESTR